MRPSQLWVNVHCQQAKLTKWDIRAPKLCGVINKTVVVQLCWIFCSKTMTESRFLIHYTHYTALNIRDMKFIPKSWAIQTQLVRLFAYICKSNKKNWRKKKTNSNENWNVRLQKDMERNCLFFFFQK